MRSRRANQFLFYLDIVLLALGALVLVAMVHDAFSAGFQSNRDVAAFNSYVYRLAAEGAFLAFSMAYFLARFYKARVKDLANPWA